MTFYHLELKFHTVEQPHVQHRGPLASRPVSSEWPLRSHQQWTLSRASCWYGASSSQFQQQHPMPIKKAFRVYKKSKTNGVGWYINQKYLFVLLSVHGSPSKLSRPQAIVEVPLAFWVNKEENLQQLWEIGFTNPNHMNYYKWKGKRKSWLSFIPPENLIL